MKSYSCCDGEEEENNNTEEDREIGDPAPDRELDEDLDDLEDKPKPDK